MIKFRLLCYQIIIAIGLIICGPCNVWAASHAVACGASISSAVAAGSAGDTYTFVRCTYYGQQWFPKTGDIYLGDYSGGSGPAGTGGTVISGAWRITSWTSDGSNLYHATQGLADSTGNTQTNLPAPTTQAVITGYITGTTLHISSTTSGSTAAAAFSTIYDGSGAILAGTQIQSGGCSGGVCTVDKSQTVASVGSPITIYLTNAQGIYTSVSPAANLVYDLYVSNVVQTQLLAPGPAVAGKWWYEPAAHSVHAYFASNPVHASVTATLNTTNGGQLVTACSGATPIAVGDVVWNTADTIHHNTYITGLVSGTPGGAGNCTYQVSDSQTVGSGTVSIGLLVEFSNVSAGAVSGTSNTFLNMTFDKYATNPQVGALQGNTSMLFDGGAVTNNHGAGIIANSNSTIRNSKINHNGQSGIESSNVNEIAIYNNEIAYNNYAGFDSTWDAGGIKMANAATNITVQGNNVHDNQAVGIWADIDSANWNISNNRVYNNIGYNNQPYGGNGIMFEISFGGNTEISNNVIYGNNGAGIFISTASGVEAFGNTITVGSGNGPFFSGIVVQNIGRGNDTNGNLYQAQNVNVHNNTIIHTASDTGRDGFWNYQAFYGVAPVWNNNIYVTPNNSGQFWEFDPLNGAAGGTTPLTWTALQAGLTYDQQSQNAVNAAAATSYPVAIFSGNANTAGTITSTSILAAPPGPYMPIYGH